MATPSVGRSYELDRPRPDPMKAGLVNRAPRHERRPRQLSAEMTVAVLELRDPPDVYFVAARST